MKNDFKENIPGFPAGDDKGKDGSSTTKKKRGALSQWTESLLQMGLGESILRAGTHGLSIAGIIIVIALARMYLNGSPDALVQGAQAQVPTATPAVEIESVPAVENISTSGILRGANIHTIVPSRPRQDIVNYTVQEGDTVIGIAEKYGLQPETIFWGNPYVLQDDPHNLLPGQKLNILPLDGVYREWQAGEGLNGVSQFYGVKPEDIINYPGNHLDMASIGDFSHPNIKPGTWLIVPGGTRGPVFQGAPLGITRTDPAMARVLGPGWCDPVVGGAVGSGAFAWPAGQHTLSGFDFSAKGNHWGIDISGNLGEGAYATDSGVVVYAGWNNYGYGNMVMIDHGNGFQSLYAHLAEIYVGCGQNVLQSNPIGAIGSTGHSSGAHLHFEIMTATVKINPWDVLPPP